MRFGMVVKKRLCRFEYILRKSIDVRRGNKEKIRGEVND